MLAKLFTGRQILYQALGYSLFLHILFMALALPHLGRHLLFFSSPRLHGHIVAGQDTSESPPQPKQDNPTGAGGDSSFEEARPVTKSSNKEGPTSLPQSPETNATSKLNNSPLPANLPARSTSASTLSLPQQMAELDLHSMRNYQHGLLAALQRYRAYPSAARAQGMSGVVSLSLEIIPAGGPRIRVEKSCGHRLLDTAALGFLRQAIADVRLPPALHGQRFRLLLPVSFNLED